MAGNSSMWDRKNLEAAAKKRKKAAEELEAVNTRLERAALAYARWTGLTEERGVDSGQEKDLLDSIIREMQPEQWTGLRRLLGEKSDNRILQGLMTYSLQQAERDIALQAQEFERVPDWREAERKPSEPKRESAHRRKPRGRSR